MRPKAADTAGIEWLTAAIAGTAGATAFLSLLSRLSDLRRTQSLVESIEGAMELVAGDQLATSALQ